MTAIVETNTAPTVSVVRRHPNGVLWLAGSHYSVTDGATWQASGDTLPGPYSSVSSYLFIDANGYAYATFGDSGTGDVPVKMYRGTPNASGTSFTWDAGRTVMLYNMGAAQGNAPHGDTIAFPHNGGTSVHILTVPRLQAFSTYKMWYIQGFIDSSGNETWEPAVEVTAGGVDNYYHAATGLTFTHTGDEQTPTANPKVFTYLHATNSSAQVSAFTQFRGKVTRYGDSDNDGVFTVEGAATTDTLWTNGEVDSRDRWPLMYASGRVWAVSHQQLHSVPATGATWTTETLPAAPSTSKRTQALGYDSSTDQVWVWSAGAVSGSSPYSGPLALTKRTGPSTFTAWETPGAVVYSTMYASLPRAGETHLVYREDATSTNTHVRYVFNTPPNAPALATMADGSPVDVNVSNRASHLFSDPDPGDSQSKFDHRYRLVGAATWTESTHTTTSQFVDFPAGTFAVGNYERQVRTYDSAGEPSPWSSSGFFTGAEAPPAPTITAPTSGGTYRAAELVEWSTPNQDAYQVRVLDESDAVVFDTGSVTSSTARSRLVDFPTNGVTRTIQVRIQDGGLWSTWAEVTGTVSWIAPPSPTFIIMPDSGSGSLVISISNPAPSGDEPPAAYNDVFVNDGAGEFRVAANVAPSESATYWLPKSGRDYSGSVRVRAFAESGAYADS